MLGIVPNYLVQYQEKLMMQPRENGKKPYFYTEFSGPGICP